MEEMSSRMNTLEEFSEEHENLGMLFASSHSLPFDPEGRIMRSPTNVSWGGADLCDLYIGSIASDYVVHARSPIPGMPLVHQRSA